jgi:hypothetical protein
MDHDVYTGSLRPVSRQFLMLGEWVRTNTSPEAVFVAGPSYAPWVAALAGRRVLLVGDDVNVPQRSERELAEAGFARSESPEAVHAAAEAWSLTHLASGRLDEPEEEGPGFGVNFEYLNDSPLFSRVYQQRRWIRIYEYRPD